MPVEALKRAASTDLLPAAPNLTAADLTSPLESGPVPSGLDVEPDGSCRASDGSPSLGLAAIGRPTEDVVIGNDTLGRTLHPLSDRWARRVVQRCLDASARELVH